MTSKIFFFVVVQPISNKIVDDMVICENKTRKHDGWGTISYLNSLKDCAVFSAMCGRALLCNTSTPCLLATAWYLRARSTVHFLQLSTVTICKDSLTTAEEDLMNHSNSRRLLWLEEWIWTAFRTLSSTLIVSIFTLLIPYQFFIMREKDMQNSFFRLFLRLKELHISR